MRQINAGFLIRGLIRGAAATLLISTSMFAVAASTMAPAPEFTLPVRGANPMTMSKLKGQVVMINFWASYCGPCRQEMPLLEKMHQKYKGVGFTLLGVNVDEDVKDAEAWLSKMQSPVSFPILLDQKHVVREQYKSYGEVMPMSVFIDRKGNIRNIHRGYKPGDENAYLDQIRALLKE
ncbi:MAG TPA: TlpA disulfide reductase family protein [Steroidobacteraceae bacterium]|nr:TlpA disulfide reductase family protein [Steroidobacteraceae bacterium]